MSRSSCEKRSQIVTSSERYALLEAFRSFAEEIKRIQDQAKAKAQDLFARDQQTSPSEAIVCFYSQLDTTSLEMLRQQKDQCVIVLEAALDTTGKWNLHHYLRVGLVVF